ncbi:MAG: SIMPL domain-containing protein [Pseudomonadota bacterium]
MRRTHFIVTGILLLALAAPVSAEVTRTITVTGEGEAEAAPDMALITLGVLSEGPTAREATRANSRAMADILAEIAQAGVAERDVQTSGFNVYPRWENRPNEAARIAGFIAENRVTVRARDLENLGALLDAVTREGANRFEGLSFALQDPQAAEDAARADAVADASRKARLYAEAAGLTLGAIQSISEGGSAAPVPIARAEMALSRDAGVPVAPGELSMRARVTIVYAIGD